MLRRTVAAPTMRARACRIAAATVPSPLRRNASAPAATAAQSVRQLAAPLYEKVPGHVGDPSAAFADMPALTLGGRPSVAAAARVPGGRLAEAATLSLDQPLPMGEQVAGQAADCEVDDASVMPQTRFGQLPNGVRIASIDRKGMCASVGLFVHAGSRYETEEAACVPHALELMAFRSSAHLSHLRTLKTLEQLGAGATCRVGREEIVYQFDALREYVPVLLPMMLSNVLCPSILEEEIVSARETAMELRQMAEDSTETLISELLHVTAWKGNTLGHPLYIDEGDVSKITADSVRSYIERCCTPDRLILIGVNVDFDDLSKWTASSFAEFAPASPAKEVAPSTPPLAPAVYSGGEHKVEKPNPLCHLMLGWEVEGGWNGDMLAAITVLQMFLGGGGSFSTGGPGKGMHTRLYTEVLNRYHWVESCQASSVLYADSGLFTIYATVVPQHAADFVSVMANIFRGLKRISNEELQRAKNALKSSIHINLEMRAVVMEDIGRQLTLSGKVGTTQEFGAMVDAVTVEDMLGALRKCLRTRPTVVAYGAVERVPSLEEIERIINKSAMP